MGWDGAFDFMIPRINLSQGSRPFSCSLHGWSFLGILVACLLFPFLARSLVRVLVVDWLVGGFLSSVVGGVRVRLLVRGFFE